MHTVNKSSLRWQQLYRVKQVAEHWGQPDGQVYQLLKVEKIKSAISYLGYVRIMTKKGSKSSQSFLINGPVYMRTTSEDDAFFFNLLTVTPTPYLKCPEIPNLIFEVDGFEAWLELDQPYSMDKIHRKVTHEEFERFALASNLATPPSDEPESEPTIDQTAGVTQPAKLSTRERDNLLKTIAALLRMYIMCANRGGKKYGTPDDPNYHQLSILIDQHLMEHNFSNMGMATRTLADRLKQSISTLMAEKKT